MEEVIRYALMKGIMVAMQPPVTARDRGMFIIEAYKHSSGARAKRIVYKLQEVYGALREVVNEVAITPCAEGVMTIATDDGSDLV